jgi:glycosyltransferase involved in cell wall biosynthesis
MPLRILIDARRLRDFGVGTYTRNLVRGLAKIDRANQYTLIVSGEPVPEFNDLPANFRQLQFNHPRGLLTDLRFSWFVRRCRADVYHVPVNDVPIGMPGPYIVTVHDVGNLLFAKNPGVRNNLEMFRFRHGLLNAARLIAVSNATRRDIETLIDIPASRIQIIYNAPDPAFVEPNFPSIACVGSELFQYPPEMQRILDRYQIHYPFLLYAGRTNPQKNIPRLVEAFAVLRGELTADPLYRDLRLIIIGDEISKYPSLRHAVIQSRVEDTVRFLGFVPIDTLRVFYQAAAAFVFPSLYEGFGLPPLEAMACGTPVVASHVSALAEVVGDAASIVNPENVFDIARGIKELLLDRELRGTLIRRGFAQLKRFSWEKSAAQVLATYEEVALSKK